jgi:hypothetical protein
MSTVEETNTGHPVENVSTDKVTQNTTEFTRGVVESLGKRIRVVDQDETLGLDLFCYDKCEPSDGELIRNCRGVVFHKNDLVMKAFPYTVEYNLTDPERAHFEESILDVFKDCSFYDSHEGVLIRMFNFEGKWFTSTHRKLNAFRSKWASRESFGSAFKKALDSEVENNSELRKHIPEGEGNLFERFQSTLDTSKQYMFLVRHSDECRIVCKPPSRPTLYHVGTFVEGELVMTEDIHVSYPRKHTFLTVDELYNYVNESDVHNLQGVIVFAPNNIQYKIMQEKYQEFFNVRGNEPSIKFRYLQVRMDSEKRNKLYYLYPEMTSTMNTYENTIHDISESIYTSYRNRFIEKMYVTVPREEFKIIQECHSWHQADRTNNIVSDKKVMEVINKQSPTNINRMIRRLLDEKSHKTEGGSVIFGDNPSSQFKTRNRILNSNTTNTTS